MAITIDHDLEINAPAEVVWAVLTDTDSYGEWNPFVLECDATLEPGAAINMKVRLGKGIQKANEVIKDVTPGKGFSYNMKPIPVGALHSLRSHDIEPIDGSRCRYRSHFELNGWLSPLVVGLMGSKLQAGFDGMSHGIKARAEALSQKAA